MDRRQRKTREAIFEAFGSLIAARRYSSITVQDIIDKADIGRSTFYAHFSTKDELLKAMCTDMFRHVFLNSLAAEKTHDFSGDNHSLEVRLSHVLHHLKDNRKNIIGILSSESAEIFMKYFKEYLNQMFSQSLEEFQYDVPADFLLNHLAGSFAETVNWWIEHRMSDTPEDTAGYFMEVIRSVHRSGNESSREAY